MLLQPALLAKHVVCGVTHQEHESVLAQRTWQYFKLGDAFWNFKSNISSRFPLSPNEASPFPHVESAERGAHLMNWIFRVDWSTQSISGSPHLPDARLSMAERERERERTPHSPRGAKSNFKLCILFVSLPLPLFPWAKLNVKTLYNGEATGPVVGTFPLQGFMVIWTFSCSCYFILLVHGLFYETLYKPVPHARILS